LEQFNHEVVEHMGSGQMMCELLLEQGVKASKSRQGWAAWSKLNGVAALHGRYQFFDSGWSPWGKGDLA
jgi:hypothetical protein